MKRKELNTKLAEIHRFEIEVKTHLRSFSPGFITQNKTRRYESDNGKGENKLTMPDYTAGHESAAAHSSIITICNKIKNSKMGRLFSIYKTV